MADHRAYSPERRRQLVRKMRLYNRGKHKPRCEVSIWSESDMLGMSQEDWTAWIAQFKEEFGMGLRVANAYGKRPHLIESFQEVDFDLNRYRFILQEVRL